METCEICKHVHNSDALLRTDYWVVALAPDQGYLGRCYVTLREHKGSLRELSQAEWTDYEAIVRRLETACSKAFQAAPFNWACMMNNAYQATPPSPHVHWHFRPRYKQSITINGVEFSDPQFGRHYDPNQRVLVDIQMLREIAGRIKAAMDTYTD